MSNHNKRKQFFEWLTCVRSLQSLIISSSARNFISDVRHFGSQFQQSNFSGSPATSFSWKLSTETDIHSGIYPLSRARLSWLTSTVTQREEDRPVLAIKDVPESPKHSCNEPNTRFHRTERDDRQNFKRTTEKTAVISDSLDISRATQINKYLN